MFGNGNVTTVDVSIEVNDDIEADKEYLERRIIDRRLEYSLLKQKNVTSYNSCVNLNHCNEKITTDI